MPKPNYIEEATTKEAAASMTEGNPIVIAGAPRWIKFGPRGGSPAIPRRLPHPAGSIERASGCR